MPPASSPPRLTFSAELLSHDSGGEENIALARLLKEIRMLLSDDAPPRCGITKAVIVMLPAGAELDLPKSAV